MAKNDVPNIFTFCNLALGILSILMLCNSSNSNSFNLSCIFIIGAAIINRYENRLSSYLKVSDKLTKELSSLTNIVSFGVAPAILSYNLNHFETLGIIGYLLVLIFPFAGAFRLARYNVSSFEGYFTGLPITVAAVLLSVYSLICNFFNKSPNQVFPILLIVLLSYLMVSNLKIKKL